MFRLLKIIFITLLILIVIAAAALTYFLKTFDISLYKSEIESQLTTALNRKVVVDNLSLNASVQDGAKLIIQGLSIADDNAYSDKPMIEAGEISLNINILHFISNRELLFSDVVIDQPIINIVKLEKERINVLEVLDTKGKDESSKKDSSPQKIAEDTLSENQMPKFLIHSVVISQGSFQYLDRSGESPSAITVKNLNFKTTNLSLDRPFRFSLTSSLWSDTQNIEITGMMKIVAAHNQLQLKDIKLKTDLEKINFERLAKDIPVYDDLGLGYKVNGQVDVSVPMVNVSQGGMPVVEADIRFTDGKVQYQLFPYPVENIDMRLTVKDNVAKLNELFLYLASGKIMIKGEIVDPFNQQLYSLDLSVEDAQVSELLPKEALPFEIKGKLYCQYEMKGQGLDLESLKKNITGKGSLELQEGELVEFNLLRFVLANISPIPNLVNIVENNLADKYKELLTVKDTKIEKMLWQTKIAQGALIINTGLMDVEGYIFSTQGKLDFNQNLQLSSELNLSRELSAKFVDAAGDLVYLTDEDEQINIKMKDYDGPVSQYKPLPDIGDLGKKIIRTQGKEELKKVIYKALDLDDVDGTPSSNPANDGAIENEANGSGNESPPSPEAVIIENILDSILK